MLKKLITISITAIASLQAATTYNKSLTDGNDNLNYWSDTTSSNLTNHTLVGATEVFTIGSRKNIPNVPTTSIKVSTNKLCSNDKTNLVSCSKSDYLEPRYTDNGLATTGEANLRTWYKATTPKSVNGVVDDPCRTMDNTGSVVNWLADYSNLRCERTITNYTPKVNSTIYTNKVNSDLFANKLSSISTTGGINIYADKVNSDLFTNKLSSTTTTGGINIYADKIASNNSYTASLGRYLFPIPTHLFVGGPQRNRLSTLTTPYGNVTMESNASTTASINGHVLFNIVRGASMGQTFNYSATYNNMNISMVSNCSYGSSGGHSWQKASIISGTIDIYTCPSGGTLSGTTCTISTLVCPDASWSDNGGNCTKVTPIVSVTNYYCPSGYSDNGTNCKKTVKVCPDASWSDNGGNCTKVTPIVSVTNYYCPATYSDMGTYCKKTIQICPDPSWSDAGANCSKVIQICPDASWTDNGTNCKKNVPEYRLFSTF